MKKINIILFLSILFLGCSSNKEVLNLLESKYKKGNLIIVNDWVILQSDIFLDLNKKRIKLQQNAKIEKLQQDSAVSWFGHWGNEREINRHTASKLQLSNKDVVIDCSVLKVLNPNDSIFYFIDGAPCFTYRNAINLIQNKKVSEVSIISIESAIQLWGNKVGKNGAIMINTKK